MNIGCLSSATVKFSKILVAIDGSKPSMDAADYAISMANKNNSLLIALHVFFHKQDMHIQQDYLEDWLHQVQ